MTDENDHVLNWCEECDNEDKDGDVCLECLRTTLSDNEIFIPKPNRFE